MLLYMKITLLQNCTLSYKIDCNSFHVLHTVLIISRSNPIIYHLLLTILLSLFIPLDINNLSYLKLLHQITISYLSANSKKNFINKSKSVCIYQILYHFKPNDYFKCSSKIIIKALYHYSNIQYMNQINYFIHVETAMNNFFNASIEKSSIKIVYNTTQQLFLARYNLIKLIQKFFIVFNYI